MEDLHYYMQYIKFGMGRCTWDAAQEIRTGKLNRDEAISLVLKFDAESPLKDSSKILEYFNISSEEFYSIVDSFRPKHLWSLNQENEFSLTSRII